MSKIYEALQNVRQEALEVARHVTVPAQTETATLLPSPVEIDLENEMVTLYQNIEALLSGTERKTIEFIGSRCGEGTSTIVRQFAKVAAMKLGKTVFLLDAGQRNPKQCIYFHITPDTGWEEVPREELGAGICTRVSEMDVEMSRVSPIFHAQPPNFYSPEIKRFWDSLKENYDLVLIDAPPAADSPDGIEIARRVDGVVLVVEAEKTRWQVVENLKGKIEHCGGNILGAVFNKRRFYIPEFIYRRF